MAKPILGIIVAGAVVVLAGSTISTGPARPSVAVAAQVQAANPIISSEISLSTDRAQLRLELAGGRTLDLALVDGQVLVDELEVGTYTSGDPLDQAWRALLRAVIDTPAQELTVLLSAWPHPPGTAGEAIATALSASIGSSTAALPAASPIQNGAAVDSLQRLEARVQALERVLRELGPTGDDAVAPASPREPRAGGGGLPGPAARFVRGFWNGLTLLVSTVIAYAVLLAIGCAVVFFGRRYLEGIADTVRHATIQSGLVGIAATVLILPAFAVGAVALAISVIGIPLLLVWIPLFPVAVVLAAVVGFLAAAHATGEAMAERRLHGVDWFKANSYYFLATGLAVLAAAFAAAFIVYMLAGPWLTFVRGILIVIGIVITWLAVTLGFGALLISRFGTRPAKPATDPELSLPFDE